MKGSFKEVDFGYLNLKNVFTEEELHSVKVGVLKAEDHEGSGGRVTVQEVAMFHEFGTVNIPERSFMRSTMVENEKAIAKLVAKLTTKIVNGSMKKEDALEELGIFIQTKILKKIESNIAPVTKKDMPMLIDTWQMYSSIDWEVETA